MRGDLSSLLWWLFILAFWIFCVSQEAGFSGKILIGLMLSIALVVVMQTCSRADAATFNLSSPGSFLEALTEIPGQKIAQFGAFLTLDDPNLPGGKYVLFRFCLSAIKV